MKKNLGSADKLVRFLLAVVLGTLYFTDTVTGTAGIVLLIVGLVLLATVAISFCPLYALLHISTCKTKNAA